MFSFMKKNESKKPALRKTIPALVLNKNWHDLFPGKKTSKIQSAEKKLEGLLKKYSQVKQDLKEYENLKKQLMDGILADMDSISEESKEKLDKKMETNTNLIYDLNARMENAEEDLLDIPKQIDECNRELILYTAEVFYPKLIENTVEHQQLTEEVGELKRTLRQKLERKLELEEENDNVYQRLHQILGAELLNELDEFFIGRQLPRKAYDLKGRVGERGSEKDSVFLEEKSESEE